jgi:hypothetical protein
LRNYKRIELLKNWAIEWWNGILKLYLWYVRVSTQTYFIRGYSFMVRFKLTSGDVFQMQGRKAMECKGMVQKKFLKEEKFGK